VPGAICFAANARSRKLRSIDLSADLSHRNDIDEHGRCRQQFPLSISGNSGLQAVASSGYFRPSFRSVNSSQSDRPRCQS